MIIKKIKSDGLAHLSYFVGLEHEALVIDPRRDCQVYLDMAQREGMTILHIFETHRNEDYVIGSLELAHLTGATIYHGAGLDFKYGEPLKDGQEFRFGKTKITALHTPGHTDESMSYTLTDLDTGKDPLMVFTGDALFVGDVGRIDSTVPTKPRGWHRTSTTASSTRCSPSAMACSFTPPTAPARFVEAPSVNEKKAPSGWNAVSTPSCRKTRTNSSSSR